METSSLLCFCREKMFDEVTQEVFLNIEDAVERLRWPADSHTVMQVPSLEGRWDLWLSFNQSTLGMMYVRVCVCVCVLHVWLCCVRLKHLSCWKILMLFLALKKHLWITTWRGPWGKEQRATSGWWPARNWGPPSGILQGMECCQQPCELGNIAFPSEALVRSQIPADTLIAPLWHAETLSKGLHEAVP